MKEKYYKKNQVYIFNQNKKESLPVVSVIVPVYKVEKYLQQCIDSICAQTYSRLEILLIDDGSPDCCGDICEYNAGKDPRIKVVHKENGGVSSARNVGIDMAGGRYFSFVDADDMIHPGFIETLLGYCKRYGCDIAQCDVLNIGEDFSKLPLNPRQYLHLYSNRQAVHQLCSGNERGKYAVVWNKMYKKELFDHLRFPLDRIHEDEAVMHLLYWKSGKIAVTNQYLYYYLHHGASIMGKPFSTERLDGLTALEERLVFLGKNGFEEEYADTQETIIYLIDKYCRALKQCVTDYEEIYSELMERKGKIAGKCPISEKQEQQGLSDGQIRQNCAYPADSRIVLYGAGYTGQQFYQWIRKKHHGILAGWVDNRWYTFQNEEYPVMPLDYLQRVEFDYVLIAVGSKTLRKEIFENLVSWGVPEKKILACIEEGRELFNDKHNRTGI